jgi:hypothetical protein
MASSFNSDQSRIEENFGPIALNELQVNLLIRMI